MLRYLLIIGFALLLHGDTRAQECNSIAKIEATAATHGFTKVTTMSKGDLEAFRAELSKASAGQIELEDDTTVITVWQKGEAIVISEGHDDCYMVGFSMPKVIYDLMLERIAVKSRS